MIRTLKNVWYAGWRVRVRCFVFGPHHKAGWRDHTVCDHTTELDLKTLVWTRGNLPLEEFEKRLRCPRCGNRRIQVMYEIPNRPKAQEGRKW